MPTPETRLAELGVQLPDPNPAVANYVGAVTVGEIVFVSGHGPYENGEYSYKGKLGRDLDVPTGQKSARLTIVNLLASLKAEVGELDRVTRVVKLLVLVNSDPEVLVYFIAFLRRHFGVPNERMRVRCNLFADHQERQREVEFGADAGFLGERLNVEGTVYTKKVTDALLSRPLPTRRRNRPIRFSRTAGSS